MPVGERELIDFGATGSVEKDKNCEVGSRVNHLSWPIKELCCQRWKTILSCITGNKLYYDNTYCHIIHYYRNTLSLVIHYDSKVLLRYVSQQAPFCLV